MRQQIVRTNRLREPPKSPPRRNDVMVEVAAKARRDWAFLDIVFVAFQCLFKICQYSLPATFAASGLLYETMQMNATNFGVLGNIMIIHSTSPTAIVSSIVELIYCIIKVILNKKYHLKNFDQMINTSTLYLIVVSGFGVPLAIVLSGDPFWIVFAYSAVYVFSSIRSSLYLNILADGSEFVSFFLGCCIANFVRTVTLSATANLAHGRLFYPMEDPVVTTEENTQEVPEAPVARTDSQESTSSSQPPPTPVSSKNKEYNKNAYIMLDVNHKQVEPKDVIEYEWPPKSGDRWFLQEQIGELLNIKSFSRKYPDFSRRKVNHEEREYLEWNYGVNRLLNETQLRDMNAMRASEIHDMMNSDFADIYFEYKRVVAQREKEIQLEKAKEMEAIKNDSVKLAELRKKAVESAVAFNKDLQNQRRNDRAHFWDIQTNIIQSRRNRWLVMKPSATRPGPYPVALIPGQFQDYYKEFTPEELNRLPLGTVMDTSHLYPPLREPSPPPLTIAEQDLIRQEKEEAMRAREATLMPPMIQVKQEPMYTPAPLDPSRPCDACEKPGGEMICCAVCKIAYHPRCIEMPDRMAALVKTYEWSCVDCRVCSICHKPEKEEELVFCDRCDRGFHSFCVGLKSMPRGSWICTTFCSPQNIRDQARRSSLASIGVGGGGRR